MALSKRLEALDQELETVMTRWLTVMEAG